MMMFLVVTLVIVSLALQALIVSLVMERMAGFKKVESSLVFVGLVLRRTAFMDSAILIVTLHMDFVNVTDTGPVTHVKFVKTTISQAQVDPVLYLASPLPLVPASMAVILMEVAFVDLVTLVRLAEAVLLVTQ